MSEAVSIDEARAVLGNDVLGPQEVTAALGAAAVAGIDLTIPLSAATLNAAKKAGAMLVLRTPRLDSATPLTIVQMLQRHADAFDQRFLRKVGYQLKDEWGIELEPSAASDTCHPGWALVGKAVLAATLNLAYDQQEEPLQRYAADIGAATAAVRRRSAVEIVYDTLLYFLARRERLLAKTWDWSATRTIDGGYLNAGGFGAQGIQIFSYSKAVRHGALGVCPTLQPGR